MSTQLIVFVFIFASLPIFDYFIYKITYRLLELLNVQNYMHVITAFFVKKKSLHNCQFIL